MPSKFIVVANDRKRAINMAWEHGVGDFQARFDKIDGAGPGDERRSAADSLVDVVTFFNWRLSFTRLDLAMDRCKNSIRVVLVGTLWSRARITSGTAVVVLPRLIGMVFTHYTKEADTTRIGRLAHGRIRQIFGGKEQFLFRCHVLSLSPDT